MEGGLNMNGYVSIYKVFDNGDKEAILLDSCNTLTDGFGMSIASILTSDPEYTIEDIQFRYFQLGSSSWDGLSGVSSADFSNSLPRTTHNNIFNLKSPFTLTSQYGNNTSMTVVERECFAFDYPFADQDKIKFYTEPRILCKLGEENSTTINDGILRVKIKIDKEGANNQTIRELGLYTKNIERYTDLDKPILAAYKAISPPFVKTDDYALEIEWVFDLRNSSDIVKNLSNVLSFYPSVMPAQDSLDIKNIVSITPSNKYECNNIVIETTTPTTKNGYLEYSIDSDITGSSVWDIPDAYMRSPAFIKAGTSRIVIPLRHKYQEEYFNENFIKVSLDSFTATTDTQSSSVIEYEFDAPTGNENAFGPGTYIFTDPNASGGGTAPCTPKVTIQTDKSNSKLPKDSFMLWRPVRNGQSGLSSNFRKGDCDTSTPCLIGISWTQNIEAYFDTVNEDNDAYFDGDGSFYDHWHSSFGSSKVFPFWSYEVSAINGASGVEDYDKMQSVCPGFTLLNQYYPYTANTGVSNSEIAAGVFAEVPCGAAIKYIFRVDPGGGQDDPEESVFINVTLECEGCES